MSEKSVLLASAACLPLLLIGAPAAAQVSGTAPVAPAEAPSQTSTATNPAGGSVTDAGALPQADTTAAAQDGGNGDIVVTGFRASLQNAARIKRDSAQIQDSIVAEDVGKLPDTNIAETLQRIPGVQILRNARGEGNGYAVHGLTQVQTVLNGRGIFSTSNRNASLLDLSADILSGIDVYKTATADQIEGGLGGLINVRTARPFDYSGSRYVVSAAGNYSRIRDKVEPRLAALASNRWQTPFGELGFLVGLTYERVTTGAYDTNVNAYVNRTDLYDVNGNGNRTNDSGDTITTPTQAQARYTYGDRTRFTVTSSAQWKPSDSFTLYLDGLYAYSNGKSATQGLAVQTQASTAATAVAPFTFKAGSTVPSTSTYRNGLVISSVGATTNPYRIYQGAIGGSWERGGLTLSGEFSYSESGGPFYSRSLNLTTRAPSTTITLSETPDLSVTGVDLNNPASYTYSSFSDLKTFAFGKEPVVRFDAQYEFPDGFLKSVVAGVRYVDHETVTESASINYSTSNSALSTAVANIVERTPDRLFSSQDSSLNQWVGVGLDYLRDAEASRVLIGASGSDPAYAPTSHYEVNEKVLAGYAMANFGFNLASVPIDGNIGLRALKTSSDQMTNQTVAGVLTPVRGSSEYENYLPSINVRTKFTPDLFLRLAASKAISRPAYGDLSPALTVSPSTGTGSGGNPNLTPVKADQYDASLEYYFGRSNLIVASVFKKDVSGFVQNFAADETIGGVSYRVSRPRNGGDGEIKGFELNYQQFLDFLPGPLSGLGVQANYTYVDSAIENLSINRTAPAENLSKHSYNITGIYEKGPVSLRLAYNWRGQYVATTSADSAGRPLYIAPLGQLDLSMTYALSDKISLKLDAVNLTNTFRYQYYGTEDLPQIANEFDRSIEAGVRIRF